MTKSQIFGHRDGFRHDSVMSIQDWTTHNPIFMGGVLAFLAKRSGAPMNLSFAGWLSKRQNRTWSVTICGIFFGLAVYKQISDALSFRARNNGVSDEYVWTKEIVLITGASSGIGARTAQMLAERGIKVVGLDVQQPTYELPPRMKFYTCDITKREQLEQVGKSIKADVGEVTILVNNAGIARALAPIVDCTEEDTNAVMQINALSHFKTVQEFLPTMLKHNHGHVITIASMASYVSPPGIASYGMSKAAAVAFHYTLAAELVHFHECPRIRTSLINPLWTRTPLLDSGLRQSDQEGNKALVVMHVDTVAEAIVDVILGGTSEHRCLPRSATIGSSVRGLHDWLHFGVLKRISKDMKQFHQTSRAT